eukprot:9377313-Alexandrium_andersonii.AAC.1
MATAWSRDSSLPGLVLPRLSPRLVSLAHADAAGAAPAFCFFGVMVACVFVPGSAAAADGGAHQGDDGSRGGLPIGHQLPRRTLRALVCSRRLGG